MPKDDKKSSLKGAWSGHVNHLNYDGHNYISGTAKAKLAKFCTQIEYISRLKC